MKTAMKVFAVTVALAFFVTASMAQGEMEPAAPSAATPTGKESKVFEVLQTDTQFSMFYEALVNSTEIWNVEGRIVVAGQQLILFAPTNVAFSDALSEDLLTCLQEEPGQYTLMNFLQYFQVLVPSVPQVETPKQLVSMADTDGYVWSVSGKGIAVEEEADGSLRLTSDDGLDSVTVQTARVTDPTVTLIPLEVAVIVQADVTENITTMCFGGQASTFKAAASSSSPPLSKVDEVSESSRPSGPEAEESEEYNKVVTSEASTSVPKSVESEESVPAAPSKPNQSFGRRVYELLF